MFYDKKVKYFDYRKNGVRIHGAGFLKIDVRNGMCSMLLQVSGLHSTDSFCKQVYLVGANREEEMCTIWIREGRGEHQLRIPVDNMANGLSYEGALGVRIPIAAGYELYCNLRNLKDMNDATEEVILPEQITTSEMMAELTISEERGDVPETEEMQEEETEEIEAPVRKEMRGQKIMEDKWNQLWTLYPHIVPFEDEREYLKIDPEDFVILSSRSYKLVHNSFLLHGYYNYRHLILSRLEKKSEPYYYIGVPGNFYDREKQVAIMFGFESFACREEPADPGEYGYYMIRVEL